MKRKKILIVDDDEDVLLGLRVRLGARGYATVLAINAHWAIRVAQDEKPDLILLDLGLPDGNGFMVMEKLKQINGLASIPIIIVSARPLEVYKDAALLGGAKGYFQKPFDNEALLAAIHKELAGPVATPESNSNSTTWQLTRN
jgi:two-component system KDP operon response regulator KdpE